MGRRYVRDKAGRFAAKGGGSKGKGGKMGKSAKNVKARAAYKNQAGKLREAKKMGKFGKEGSRERKYWTRQLGGAKSGMTRVSNRLAGKGKGAAATKAVGTGPKKARGIKKRRGAKVYDNTTNTSIKMKTVKKNLRRKYPQSKAAKSLEKRVATKTAKKAPRKQKGKMAYDGPNKAASEARDRIIAKTKAKRMAAGGMKTPKGKISKAKPSAAKKEYKQQMGKARTLRKNVRVAPKDAARNYKREANIIEGRMKNKYGGKKGRSKISKAERNPAKNMYKKATSDLRFEKRVGLESGSKNTKSIKASQKKVKDLEKVFKNIKGKKG